MNRKVYKTCIFFSASFLMASLWFGLSSLHSESSGQKPQEELIARGKELFNAKEGLGVKFACILCHQKEKVIKKSEVLKAGEALPNVINKYMVEKAKGKAIDVNSEDMKALVAYITYEHSK